MSVVSNKEYGMVRTHLLPPVALLIVWSSVTIAAPLIAPLSAIAGCSAHVSFAGDPTAAPTYLVWQKVFQSVDERTNQLINNGSMSVESVHMLSTRAAAVRQRLTELNSSPTQRTESDKSEVVLSARDDIIRGIDRASFALLDQAASAIANNIELDTPAIGIVRADRNGSRLCVVPIRGSEYPHLVPDEAYWSFYFETRFNIIKAHLDADGHINPEYVKNVQGLAIPAQYIEQFLTAVITLKHDLETLSDDLAGESQRRQLIMDARAELIRSMPEIVWLQISHDATRSRDGISFSYSVPLR
jgi:hypothetical protein